MSREQYQDGRRQDDGAEERDALNEVLGGDLAFAPVLEALVATLKEDELPAAGWDALRNRLQHTKQERADNGAADRVSSRRDSAGPSGDHGDGGSREAQVHRVAPPLPPQVGPARVATRWIAGMVLIAAVVVAGSWGSLKAGEAAKLRDDQRILAYWMANPDMRLVPLSAPGSTVSSAPARLGVLCVLPDGRALLLQPANAPRGSTFVVTGAGSAGTQELARGRANMLLFDASGVRALEVVLARGGSAEIVAQAVIN